MILILNTWLIVEAKLTTDRVSLEKLRFTRLSCRMRVTRKRLSRQLLMTAMRMLTTWTQMAGPPSITPLTLAILHLQLFL